MSYAEYQRAEQAAAAKFLNDVLPEQDSLHRAIGAIDNVVIKIKDVVIRRDTLRRIQQHLNARIEQNHPTGDWLND